MKHVHRALCLIALALAIAAPAAWAADEVQINGRPLDEAQARTLAALEQRIGPVPPGAYWYDVRTGAAGRWGGPVAAFLPPGLPLAGPLPADASGGGQGRLTAVFINGRELHPSDVMALRDRKSTRLNSSHIQKSRMPSSA